MKIQLSESIDLYIEDHTLIADKISYPKHEEQYNWGDYYYSMTGKKQFKNKYCYVKKWQLFETSSEIIFLILNLEHNEDSDIINYYQEIYEAIKHNLKPNENTRYFRLSLSEDYKTGEFHELSIKDNLVVPEYFILKDFINLVNDGMTKEQIKLFKPKIINNRNIIFKIYKNEL